MNPEMPVYQDQPKRSGLGGCFLLTPLGCFVGACISVVACVCIVPLMATIGLGALGALFLTNTASKTGSQTYAVESLETARLQINNDQATVNIIGQDVDDITVDYKITTYSYSTGAAQEALKTVNFNINRRADNTIELVFDQQNAGISFYDVELDVRVPAEMHAIVINTNDDVTIDDVASDLQISAGSGQVTLTNVTGAINVTNGSGDVQWTGILPTQSTNNVTTTLGNIQFTFQQKANVRYTATSTSGRVTCPLGGSRSTCTERLGDGTAQLNINSDSGNITVITNQP